MGPLFGRGEPRYSKTDEEMQAIATERTVARLNAVLDVIRKADPLFMQLTTNDAAASTLHLASTILDSELGRVHLECAIVDEPPGPLRSID
jgi:hypothetical protein